MKRLLVLSVLLIVSAGSAQGTTRLVPGQYSTIQAAVDAAIAGDVVLIAPGVYSDVTHTPGGGDTTKCVVVMKSGITLRGMGRGRTIIDANQLGRGIQCTGVTNASIESMTIREAFAQIHGAGIFCLDGSSPLITDCELTSNFDGAFICYNASSPTLEYSRLTINAGKEGAAIALYLNSSPVVRSCFIDGSIAPAGAAIIVRDGSAPQFIDCVVTNSLISAPGGFGGGVGVVSASATLLGCRIEDNTATGGGGGCAFSQATIQMTNCLVQSNRTTGAYGPGGGVFIDFESNVVMEGCTITRNSIVGNDLFSDGGGVCINSATQVTLRQCTISANTTCTSGFGGAIAVFTCNPVIEKCILSHSIRGAGMACDEESVPVVSCTDLYGNLNGNSICGTNGGQNFSQDPLFCDLAGDDYRLQAASPCAAGQHPSGAGACNGSRLGANDVGCSPLGVTEGVPTARLVGNSPNPFQPATTIRFDLVRASLVVLEVFDVAGRKVRTLENSRMEAGRHESSWDGSDDGGLRVSGGVYFYRLTADGMKESRRMVLAR
jgi:hypothetical protein